MNASRAFVAFSTDSAVRMSRTLKPVSAPAKLCASHCSAHCGSCGLATHVWLHRFFSDAAAPFPQARPLVPPIALNTSMGACGSRAAALIRGMSAGRSSLMMVWFMPYGFEVAELLISGGGTARYRSGGVPAAVPSPRSTPTRAV